MDTKIMELPVKHRYLIEHYNNGKVKRWEWWRPRDQSWNKIDPDTIPEPLRTRINVLRLVNLTEDYTAVYIPSAGWIWKTGPNVVMEVEG